MEIGSGVGGGTRALREQFVDSHLSLIDRDPRAAKIAYMHQLGAFRLADVTKLSPEKLGQLLHLQDTNEPPVDHISMLRTAGEAILALLQVLSQTSFRGELFFSLIMQTDRQHLVEVVNSLQNLSDQGRISFQTFTMHEGRDFTEKGWLVTFE